jgi:hypothetical protein
MKGYVAVTAGLFALLTIVHVWRAVIEPEVRTSWFAATTILSLVLCLWALRLWRRLVSTSSGER